MAKQQIIVGLDIGTSIVRTVVASFKEGEEKPKVIGVGEAQSHGMKKGSVNDIEEVAESIKKSVEQAEINSGISIQHAYVSIGGNHIDIRDNKGMIVVSRADQEISEEDISRVINTASATPPASNRQTLDIIPREFKVDDEAGIQIPLGMVGTRLEADVLIVDGLTPHIKNLEKSVSKATVKTDRLVLNVLAASEAVTSKRQKELGVLVLDLGGGTAGMAVYEDGKLFHTHILPIGATHITNDIAIGLRIAIDLAEKLKIKYGSAMPSEVDKKENINLAELGEEEDIEVNRHEISKIVEARCQEIFDLVNKELKKIGKQRLLPAGVVLVGGGALIPGIVALAKKELGLPVEIGIPAHIEGLIEKIDSPTFATAIGLILFGLQVEQGKDPQISTIDPALINKIKKVFRSLLP